MHLLRSLALLLMAFVAPTPAPGQSDTTSSTERRGESRAVLLQAGALGERSDTWERPHCCSFVNTTFRRLGSALLLEETWRQEPMLYDTWVAGDLAVRAWKVTDDDELEQIWSFDAGFVVVPAGMNTMEGFVDAPSDGRTRRIEHASLYRVSVPGCCADRSRDVYYSLHTGKRLFSASHYWGEGVGPPVFFRIAARGELTASRFVTYDGRFLPHLRGRRSLMGIHSTVGGGPDVEWEEGMVGVLRYGDDREPARAFAVYAPVGVCDVRLRSPRGGSVGFDEDEIYELDGRDLPPLLRLPGNRDTSPGQLYDGFAVVLTFCGELEEQPLVIPVMEDAPAVGRAEGPATVRVAPAVVGSSGGSDSGTGGQRHPDGP